MAAHATSNRPIGSPVERLEDLRFLRGRGQFVDDVPAENALHAVILRSSVAHGRIRSVDVSAALKRSGVRAVITASDIEGEIPVITMRQELLPEFKPYQQPVIAREKVRYVGEPLAVVVADSAALAEDALDAIVLDIETLPAVADRNAARRTDSLLFEATGRNHVITLSAVKGDAEAAFKDAPYTRREKFSVQRFTAVTMEPRGLLAQWDEAKQHLTVSGLTKVVFHNRRILAKQMGLPEESITMIEADVGGGFGVRGEFYPEDFLIPFAARKLKRAVKWIEDRRENLIASNHARDAECELEIACERDGTIRGLRGQGGADLGAYIRTNGVTAARNTAQVLSGPYRVPNIHFDMALLLTNKTPSGTYRGPGRFEADFFRERLFDMAANDLGHRPRRIPPQKSRRRKRDAVAAADRAAARPGQRDRHRRLPADARPLPARLRLGGEIEAPGQTDRGPPPRHRRRLLSRRRRLGPPRERPHGAGSAMAPSRSTPARPRSGRASRR